MPGRGESFKITVVDSVVWRTHPDRAGLPRQLRGSDGRCLDQPQHLRLRGDRADHRDLFAFALGAAAGAVIRRTVPAMAVTLAGYLGVRLTLQAGIESGIYLAAAVALFAIAAWWALRRIS